MFFVLILFPLYMHKVLHPFISSQHTSPRLYRFSPSQPKYIQINSIAFISNISANMVLEKIMPNKNVINSQQKCKQDISLGLIYTQQMHPLPLKTTEKPPFLCKFNYFLPFCLNVALIPFSCRICLCKYIKLDEK